MLSLPLAAARLGKMKALDPPAGFFPDHCEKAPQKPAVSRILQTHVYRQIIHILCNRLLINGGPFTDKRFRYLSDILMQIFPHLINSPGKLIVTGSHNVNIFRQKTGCSLRVPQFKPSVAKLLYCFSDYISVIHLPAFSLLYTFRSAPLFQELCRNKYIIDTGINQRCPSQSLPRPVHTAVSVYS